VMAAATLRPTADPARFVGAVALADATGTVLLDVCGIGVVRLDERTKSGLHDKFFEIMWQQIPLGSDTAAAGRMTEEVPGQWLILAETPVARAGAEPVLDALRMHHACVVVDDADEDGVAAALATSPQVIVMLFGPRGHDECSSDPGGMVAAEERVMRVMRTIRAVFATGLRDIPRLYLVTRGAQSVRDGESVALDQATFRGVARVLGYEHPELRTTLVDLDPTYHASGDWTAGNEGALVAELHANAEDDEVAFRDGTRWCARLAATPLPGRVEWVDVEVDAAESALELVTTQPGRLEGLRLQLGDPRAPDAGEVTIRIEVAALNFSDVLKASGAYPVVPGTRAQLGGECVGTVVALGPGTCGLAVGDRVVAYAHGAFGTYTTTPADLVAHLPEGMSAEEGATLPVAYGTAWYALTQVARLRAGERVLIHAATGGVGLAAVAIAKALGADICATAGSAEKRAYLRQQGITQVYDSRGLDWYQAVRTATGGLGVDVVLNSLSGEALRRGVELLAPGGRFVELGKKDTDGNASLPLRLLARGATFTTLDLDLALRLRPEFGRQLLAEILAEVHAGRIAPLPHRTFPLTEASAAFRLMARAGHIGKIVLTCRDLGRIRAVAEPGPVVRRDGGYLVTGGLGGLGLVTAEWLARQGAGLVVLNGRTRPDGEASRRLEKMRTSGTRVEVVTGDISVPGTGRRVLDILDAAGYPLRGIVHSAAVLADATALRLTPEALARVFAPKVRGAWYLHEVSAGHPLDFFVVYSSAASLIGSPGQTAYAAANSWLDGFISYRRALGLPGLAINWGPWGEVGRATGFAARGYQVISPDEGVQALAELIASGRARTGVFALDARRWFQTFPAVAASSYFARIGAMSAVPTTSGRVRGALEAIAPGPARLAHLEAYLTQEVRAVLHMEAAFVDRQTPFASLGVDSLMALELRNRIEAECGVRLPATVVWTYPCVAQLAGALAERIGLDLGSTVACPPPGGLTEDTETEQLDDDDNDLLVRICSELSRGDPTEGGADG
ncbi:MAG: SDR family NAD(P)-dependent oxidoreductase, partial [Pseudonocardiaceae bacterium]